MKSHGSVDRIPDPVLKKRRSAFVRVFVSLLVLALVFGVLLAAVGGWSFLAFTAPGPLREAQVVDIKPGWGRAEIAAALEDKGIITDARIMSLASGVQRLRGATLKPGEYSFPAGASMDQVFNIIASGRVVEYKLTIPEGWTSEMAVARLKENEVLVGDITVQPPEGSVMANTFLFSRGMTRDKLLNSMQAAQTQLIDEIWAQKPADSIIKTKQELVTLASIVEKETGKPEERPRVAAVFLNRLKAGMRLQSDPTIIYGLVAGKGKLDRPLTNEDIDSKTPYNTYQINGLPPGPIASPGRASLEAVINPAKTPDLYFVADGTGGHVFATTLEDHNANVAKWRTIEAQQPAVAAAVAPQDGATTPDAAAVPVVTQPALPDVSTDPAAADAAVAAPADTKKKIEPAPEADTAAAETATGSKDKNKVSNTKKIEEQKLADAAAADGEQPIVLKPGTIMEINGKLIPIPALKKKKP